MRKEEDSRPPIQQPIYQGYAQRMSGGESSITCQLADSERADEYCQRRSGSACPRHCKKALTTAVPRCSPLTDFSPDFHSVVTCGITTSPGVCTVAASRLPCFLYSIHRPKSLRQRHTLLTGKHIVFNHLFRGTIHHKLVPWS